MQFIDLKTQYERYRTAIDARIRAVLDHGRFIMGPEIGELETALADYVGVRHCISVSSGTTSLEIALRALGIGPGDEVVTVPFTWISSAEVISLVGARPVFVDIELDTYNLDIDALEAAISERTRAVIAVSLFGQMPDYERINAVAARHGIAVIEDGAQSFGATQRGRRSCSVTRIASTSFFPAKPLGCYGDGGALFTDDDRLADQMQAIRTHGAAQRHHHPLIGTNGRCDTLQAAIVLAKLPHFEREVAERGRIGARYSERLRATCTIPTVAPGNTHVYAQYTIRVPDRERLAASLKERGIPTAVYYPKCLHEQPVFAPLGYRRGQFPQAERAAREVLSLPMHPFLAEADQDRVVQAVEAALEQSAGRSRGGTVPAGQSGSDGLPIPAGSKQPPPAESESEPYCAHPTAVIADGAAIGAGTRIWHFCHIMPDAEIGPSCSFGQNCHIASGVTIGARVKVQNNVSIYSGTTIEDDVFLGPSCVLTNVSNPRAQVNRHAIYEQTRIRRGATIGANATIVCGITIGRYAFIAAGAVVTRDVADYALVLGNPARQRGWMSRHGHRLSDPDADGLMICPESGYRYRVNQNHSLRCLDLDEEQPLPAERAIGTADYRSFRSP